MYAKITGTGSYLPEGVLSNAEIEKKVDTSDEWIRSRSGIERRHFAGEGILPLTMKQPVIWRRKPRARR